MTKSEQITSEKLEDHVETLSPDSFCDVTEHFQHEFEALEYQTSVHPSALSPSDLISGKNKRGSSSSISADISRNGRVPPSVCCPGTLLRGATRLIEHLDSFARIAGSEDGKTIMIMPRKLGGSNEALDEALYTVLSLLSYYDIPVDEIVTAKLGRFVSSYYVFVSSDGYFELKRHTYEKSAEEEERVQG